MGLLIKSLYALSDQYNVPLLNLWNKFQGTGTTWMDQSGHFNNTGAADAAQAVFAAVTAQIAA